MVESILTGPSWPEVDRVEEELDMPDNTENVGGYTATFVHVYNVGNKEDPLKDISNAREFFVASLS